jgi:hypothetical protein
MQCMSTNELASKLHWAGVFLGSAVPLSVVSRIIEGL